MKEAYRKLLEAPPMFHRLNLASILPQVTQAEFVVMKMISDHKDACGCGMQISKLAEATRTLPPAVSRTLKGLEEKGYVVRSVSESNRRSAYVDLTQSGKDVFWEAEKIIETFAENVFSRVDEEELERVCVFIHQIYGIAREEIEKLKGRYGKDDVKDGQNI